MLPVAIRSFDRDVDFNFILNSWVKSYQDSDFVHTAFPHSSMREVYFQEHTRAVKRILDRTTPILAVDRKQRELIYGYAVFEEPDIFHYVYIKRAFNGFGLAGLLIKNAPFQLKSRCYASHKTYKGQGIIVKNHLIYNPYLGLF